MAAGLGFKTFTTGEVLTAADTNGYLMQGINVFASTAARDAAITSPQEGQFAFTKDTNGLWYYDGAAWVASGATGDIEGVTAGTGISGGGTSGTVTITNSMATEIAAKGDLIVGTGAATFDNLAAGANGETLVADSSTSTGLRYQANFAAGKNAIINGAMNVWQRGVSITVPIANNSYSGADRFQFSRNGTASVVTCSRVAFTPGTAPQAGYEGNYFMRFNQTSAGSTGSYNEIIYRIEDVTTYAGQTATFSFWAKADSSRTLPTPVLNQNFGSGGSGTVSTNITLNSNALTTAWARYTGTITVPSISGKTIGTSSFLEIDTQLFMNTTFTFDTWGWQLEAGSVATAFQTATGTIQGELAACQRYYWRAIPGTSSTFNTLNAFNANFAYGVIPYPVTMRTNPTLGTTGVAANYRVYFSNTTTCNAVPANGVGLGTQNATLEWAATGGCSGANAAGFGWSDSGGNGYLEFKAEL